ncbi:hypothetical protein [Streptomyces capoamus]|uniref:hypothetical protein n=1 Tax=Streptomyces capoamus TaxID=68183 RepID=UPI0033995B2C
MQRTRLTGIVFSAEDLTDASQAAQQISLDTAREFRLAEQSMNRIREKFSPTWISPAAVIPLPPRLMSRLTAQAAPGNTAAIVRVLRSAFSGGRSFSVPPR